MTRPTLLRSLTWFAILPAALYSLYLITANILLNSDWARFQLDRSPHFVLSWERAWSAFPGHLRVSELTLAGTTAQRRYALEAESATLGLALIPLLQQRVRVRDLDAKGIRRLSLDEFRLQGSGTLRLRDLYWHSGELTADQLRVTLNDGSVLHGDTPLVESVVLDADLSLAPLLLADHPGNAAARFVSGTLELAGRSNAYAVFNPFLAALGWLQIGGHGELRGELAIERGELQPGSRVSLDSPNLSVQLDERHWLENGALYQVLGGGSVEAVVNEQTRLALELNDIEMLDRTPSPSPTARPRTVLSGEGFQLELAAPALRLHAPPDALQYATLRWQSTKVPDIAVFNRYLPEQLPLVLEDGSAQLQGGLSYDAERLSGGFELTGEAIALRLGEQPLTGRLSLALPIGELDAQHGTLDISGTRFEVEAAAPGEAQPLFTLLELPTARFHSPLAWRELDDDVLFSGETPWSMALVLYGRVANLGLLNPFLVNLFNGSGLTLTGGGQLDGTLNIRDGQPLEGTRLEVRSEALGARLFGFHARGDGRAQLSVRPGAGAPEASVAMELHQVDLTRLTDMRRFFQAERLAFSATAPAHASAHSAPQGQLSWHNARIPDVSVLNTYLPAPIPLRLLSGVARSDGEFTLTDELSQGQLTLRGSSIDGHLLNETFHGELDATLVLREYQYAEQSLDLSGSRLEVTASTTQDAPLHTLLVARQARLQGFGWPAAEASSDAPASQSLDGTLQLDGMVDRLGFLNTFLPAEHGLAIQGGGRLSADLRFAEGKPVPGSQLRVHSDRLTARFMHYEAFGDGSLTLTVDDPGARLHLTLPRFSLRRQAAEDALIEGQLLEIHSQAQHFALPEGLRRLNTEITMPHVAVPSLAALNDYLPQGGGVELLSGQASIATHLRLQGMRAEGTLSLHAPHARLAFDKQTLDGELRLESHLRDGDLETLSFDISGSQLSMRNVHLQHNADNLAHGWWAQLALPEGRMRWKAPLELDARLELAMRDSGLLVNLFVDAVRERRWLRDRLTLGEVLGEARVMLNGNAIRVENLAVYGGTRLELLANLALRDSHVLGRAFARYGPLRLGIEMDGEERRWQWRNARDWYFAGQPASELTLPEHLGWFEQLDTQTD